VDLAAEVLSECGLARKTALDAAAALAKGAIEHLRRSGISGALTGPVARADAGTLARQLEALARRAPLAAEVHRLLSLRVLAIAASRGRLAPADVAAMRTLLRGGPRRRGTV
jgi:predicted short-subunit dehydrogenase-like oxidoreductase (DUF2520 family)